MNSTWRKNVPQAPNDSPFICIGCSSLLSLSAWLSVLMDEHCFGCRERILPQPIDSHSSLNK